MATCMRVERTRHGFAAYASYECPVCHTADGWAFAQGGTGVVGPVLSMKGAAL
jgi:hypothetical protein